MSVTPTEPTPSTEAQPTTPASSEQPAAAATPEAPKPTPTEPSKANPWDDPKAAQAEIERLRRENGSARTNAKAQAAEEARTELAQTIGKALGLVKDEPIDPVKLTESLTTSQAEAKQARVELAVFRNASAAGADPAALLDSSSFLKSLDGIDPSDGAAISAAIQSAVAANPRLGREPGTKAPAPNPAQGAGATGPGGVAQMTRDDVERLARDGKHAEIEKARTEGRLNDLLGIK